MRAENAHGTPTQSHISPSILLYKDCLLQTLPISVEMTKKRGAKLALSSPVYLAVVGSLRPGSQCNKFPGIAAVFFGYHVALKP